MVDKIREFEKAIPYAADDQEEEVLKALQEDLTKAYTIAWDNISGDKWEEVKEHDIRKYVYLEDFLQDISHVERTYLWYQFQLAFRELKMAPTQHSLGDFSDWRKLAETDQTKPSILEKLREMRHK